MWVSFSRLRQRTCNRGIHLTPNLFVLGMFIWYLLGLYASVRGMHEARINDNVQVEGTGMGSTCMLAENMGQGRGR
jgi:hypothetical protein